MSNKKNLSAEETDLTRRKLLTSAGILAAGGMLSGAVKADEKCAVKAKPAWDKPFTGEIPEKLPEGYNILLVVTDQERFFPTFPFPVPGRERLMKTGVTFCNHQNTSNVCTPSRSVLYTGLHMPQTKMFDNMGLPWMPYDLDPALGTTGHMMRELGYYTAYKGKWHLTEKLEKPLPDEKDEDIDVGDIPEPELHKIMEKYGFADYHGIGDIIGHSKGGYFYDSTTTSQTINWLRCKGQPLNDQHKPWFLAVNLVNPHDVMFIDTDKEGEKVQWRGELDQDDNTLAPTQPPENELYQASWPNYPLPANRHQSFNEQGRPPAHLEYQTARAALEGQFPDEDRRWRKLLDYYFNCIRDCDTHLDRILNELDALKLTDKTIVVFTADHGELGGSHQMHGKGASVYKEQIHVPMIISHPAYPGNKKCQALTCHLDIAPTLVGLTGLPEEKQHQALGNRKGVNFSGLLKNPESVAVNAVRNASLYCYGMILYTDAHYLHRVIALQRDKQKTVAQIKQEISHLHPDFSHRSGTRMINDGRYKFARYFSLREHNTPETWEDLIKYNDLELYDLKNDPDENHNLAADKQKYQDLILTMNEKLNKIIKDEIGVDDGSFMPDAAHEPWDLTIEQFNRMAKD
ncbi:TPA: sulfatase-like hydrolase/transferase [Salmonella enterica subsp. enterica serovar Enteritidis]|uniref:Sulfatase-like hydrolase/transferase n=1 Tax=Salmonella enteritidis TaxID=149539 RepID=A0A726K4G2_SALEN|nr:phosphatase [Salmonella enterica subsp. enterica serovar Enteritidis]EBY4172780.1 phosphatase [Salmonella enterica subsp. enterica serovar Enteritidis]ECA5996076.1 phosphatase [Salmonella enterica subsp. enterica serovar Enteritidis]ECA6518857.1 phosphatase [Salmonella enterica subsp. enterica serovar Enteritidis]ECA8082586.1 phosphatase [Salmonella enterica subsp. enterica serovar Enteritidis]